MLIDAVALLVERGVDVTAAIAGEPGDREADIRRRVTAAGLDDRFEFLGTLSQADLFAEYRRSSVFALACRITGDGDRDGIPNVLMEAMAAELPVVSTAVSGIPELVENDVNGLLVPPEDAEALADAIWRLAKDPALAHRLARRGRRNHRRALRRRGTGAPDVETLCEVVVISTRAPLAAPLPVVCVIDHLYRDIAVAEAARLGRFTHAGVELELGRTPDWIAGGLDDDDEWRIEWVKLYEGLDLAHAYTITGQHDFLATWEDLAESFCDQVPVGTDVADVSARRLLNWLYAWRRFGDAPHFAGLRSGLADASGRADRRGQRPSALQPDRANATTEHWSSTHC